MGKFKNRNGDLGPICNNCGGFGYTRTVTGGSLGCSYCGQTGVAQPTMDQLAKAVEVLEKQVETMMKHIERMVTILEKK